MSTTWDEHAEYWDRDEPVRFYADQAFTALIRHVNVRDQEWRHRRILDFGCGTGLLTEKLSPLVREIVAVDTSPKMIDVLRDKNIANVTAICADIDDHAVRSCAGWFSDFDLIVASSVCSFLPDYEYTLGGLAQALNVPGYFVQWDWLASSGDEFGLTLERVSNAFSREGLNSIHVGQAFAVGFDDKEMPVLMGIASAS